MGRVGLTVYTWSTYNPIKYPSIASCLGRHRKETEEEEEESFFGGFGSIFQLEAGGGIARFPRAPAIMILPDPS